MSGKNKVNPDHYKVAGRLSQDDLARARRTQAEPLFGATRGRKEKPLPPWMLNPQSGRPDAEGADADDATAIDEGQANESAQADAELTLRPPAKTSRAKRSAKPAASAGSSKAKAPTKRKAAKSRNTAKSGIAAAKKRTPPAARKSPRSAAKKTSRGAAKKTSRSGPKAATRTAAKRSSRPAAKGRKAKKKTR